MAPGGDAEGWSSPLGDDDDPEKVWCTPRELPRDRRDAFSHARVGCDFRTQSAQRTIAGAYAGRDQLGREPKPFPRSVVNEMRAIGKSQHHEQGVDATGLQRSVDDVRRTSK